MTARTPFPAIASLGFVLLCLPAFAQAPWSGYDKGVRWEKSLEAAQTRAAKEHKPILFFQLVGDLDKDGC